MKFLVLLLPLFLAGCYSSDDVVSGKVVEVENFPTVFCESTSITLQTGQSGQTKIFVKKVPGLNKLINQDVVLDIHYHAINFICTRTEITNLDKYVGE